ncbi:hypothetical protein [Pseudonocardia alni]|uniref:hypothetical protein n=1 Tax=Pseudonocardia alni TaxID=33907 RepID=UPI001AD7D41F|nr:hypothetical protein [Pseudonocardia alni]MBO4239804.1 hypothetical protein [Pseudonocardia alni]
MNSAFPTGPASPPLLIRPGLPPHRGPVSAPRPVMATPTGQPAHAPGAGPSLCCDRRGQAAADPLQQILMSAVWLIPGPNSPTTARYCRACPPTGPITDLTCLLCGDGPLLVGDLAANPNDALPAAAQHWLGAAGWRLDGSVCSDCRPRR